MNVYLFSMRSRLSVPFLVLLSSSVICCSGHYRIAQSCKLTHSIYCITLALIMVMIYLHESLILLKRLPVQVIKYIRLVVWVAV